MHIQIEKDELGTGMQVTVAQALSEQGTAVLKFAISNVVTVAIENRPVQLIDLTAEDPEQRVRTLF